MNPIVAIILKVLGQVGVVHIHPTDPPENKLLIWIQTDPNTGMPIAFLDYTRGYWYPIAQVEVVDNFNSTSTTKAASARTVSHLFSLISDLTEITDGLDDAQANFVLKSSANQVNGYAKIGANGKIDPSVVDFDGLKPKGFWDASSGQPPTAIPENDTYYIVNVAGNYNLGGISNWPEGSRAYYINNTWGMVPSGTTNAYNALDQTNAGYVLDARLGPYIETTLQSLLTTVGNLTSDITDLEQQLADANDEIQDLKDKKQSVVIRKIGTIQNNQYSAAELENSDLAAWDVFVDGQMMVGNIMNKAYASTIIKFPAGFPDDTPIKIIHYPLP